MLLIGEDDVVISRLLHYGSQFAHRSVLHSHQTDLTGCVHKEDKLYSINGNIMICVFHTLYLYAYAFEYLLYDMVCAGKYNYLITALHDLMNVYRLVYAPLLYCICLCLQCYEFTL